MDNFKLEQQKKRRKDSYNRNKPIVLTTIDDSGKLKKIKGFSEKKLENINLKSTKKDIIVLKDKQPLTLFDCNLAKDPQAIKLLTFTKTTKNILPIINDTKDFKFEEEQISEKERTDRFLETMELRKIRNEIVV